MNNKGVYLMYEHSEERGNEVWAFDYKEKTVRLYKTTDPETEEDVWYMDFTDFTEAAGLKGVFPINLYNRIPIRFKSIQLCGKQSITFPVEYDQREAVNTKGYNYIFDDNTKGIEEIDMIKEYMESIHVLPKEEAPTICKFTCKLDEKDAKEFEKLFSPSFKDLKDFDKLKVSLGIDKVTFPTLMEMLVKEYNEPINNTDKKKDKETKCNCKGHTKEPRLDGQDNFGVTITFTKDEIIALNRYLTNGVTQILGNKGRRATLSSAISKIFEAKMGFGQ